MNADEVFDPVNDGSGYSAGDVITAESLNDRFDALNSLSDVTNGAMTNDGGDIGIGIASPDTVLHVCHDRKEGEVLTGFTIENSDPDVNVDKWTLYANYSSTTLTFFGGSDTYGYINDSGFNNVSDSRLKENVNELDSVLDGIRLLRPVSFNFKHSADQKRAIGFIAQEVKPLFPELVTYFREDDIYGINYSTFGVLAVKAIQEQQEQIEDLQSENEALKAEIEEIKTALGLK